METHTRTGAGFSPSERERRVRTERRTLQVIASFVVFSIAIAGFVVYLTLEKTLPRSRALAQNRQNLFTTCCAHLLPREFSVVRALDGSAGAYVKDDSSHPPRCYFAYTLDVVSPGMSASRLGYTAVFCDDLTRDTTQIPGGM